MIPGSAHLKCKAFPDAVGLAFIQDIVVTGRHPGEIRLDGVVKVDVNPIGMRGGWAFWPINFDPVWITCTMSPQDFKTLGHE